MPDLNRLKGKRGRDMTYELFNKILKTAEVRPYIKGQSPRALALSKALAKGPLWRRLALPALAIGGAYGLGRYQGYDKGKAENEDNYI